MIGSREALPNYLVKVISKDKLKKKERIKLKCKGKKSNMDFKKCEEYRTKRQPTKVWEVDIKKRGRPA